MCSSSPAVPHTTHFRPASRHGRQATGAHHGALTPATSPGPLSSFSLVSLPMALPPLNHSPWFFLSPCHPLYQGSDPSSRHQAAYPLPGSRDSPLLRPPPPNSLNNLSARGVTSWRNGLQDQCKCPMATSPSHRPCPGSMWRPALHLGCGRHESPMEGLR